MIRAGNAWNGAATAASQQMEASAAFPFISACSVSCRTGPGHIYERVSQGEQRSAGEAALAGGMQVTAAQLDIRLVTINISGIVSNITSHGSDTTELDRGTCSNLLGAGGTVGEQPIVYREVHPHLQPVTKAGQKLGAAA